MGQVVGNSVVGLGAVKPHVQRAANLLGPMFKLKTIYGWAAGQYDHPKGLALDLMINNVSNGKAVGDSIKAYCLANHDSLQLTYIIWYRKYYGRENGFREDPYTGTSNPHTDHVHLSFVANGKAIALPGGLPGRFKDTGGSNQLAWITQEGNWARIGMFIVGIALIVFGLLTVDKIKNVANIKAVK